MKRNYCLFLLVALTCFAGKSFAQSQVSPCATDDVRKRMILKHPEILQYEEDFNHQVREGIKHLDLTKFARTTADNISVDSLSDTFWYDIPIVVHIIHDYNNGTDWITDDSIYKALIDWNIVYAGANYDTSLVIPTFKPYIGIPRFRLHLATIDPNGQPTHGITRHRSYLTYIGGDESKVDDWPNTSYVNIWTVNIMSLQNKDAAAYAYFPSEAATDPWGDGVICLYNYFQNVYNSDYPYKTINHEIGHVFSLYHPWGANNNPELGCGDDEVDDTPPTHGHFSEGCAYDTTALYDTDCAKNYFKIYPRVATGHIGEDSLVDYPDTTNAQNIMDYTYCARNFTKQQVIRMQAAAQSTLADRINLWDTANLRMTGVIDSIYSFTWASGNYHFIPRRDLKPIPEFSGVNPLGGIGGPTGYMNKIEYFVFPGNQIVFDNETWNDTLTNLTWNFSNGASIPVASSSVTASYGTSVENSFSESGWVTLTMDATGNGSGDTSVTFPRAVFVASTTATPAAGYAMSFNNADTANWPTFNYYNNEFKWQMANVGYDDNNSIMYTGYDSRVIPDTSYPVTGNPEGDFDDLFSIPVDLSAFTDTCNLNFYYSGASRATNNFDMNDTLEIDYSVGKGTWKPLTYISKHLLDNKGFVYGNYVPSAQTDWAPMTIGLPASLRKDYVTFRFRYRPGQIAINAYGETYSSGNNFYLDRINFNTLPASVSSVVLNNTDVMVVPNPTNGDAYVVIKDAGNETAKVIVTDITGKIIYTIEQPVVNGDLRLQIPHDAISVKGIYIVQTITGTQQHTQKLVVE